MKCSAHFYIEEAFSTLILDLLLKTGCIKERIPPKD